MFKKIICAVVLSSGIVVGCGKSGYLGINSNQENRSFFAMDTYMKITAYGENTAEILAEAEEKIHEFEKKWSVTDEESEIFKANHSGGKKVTVSEDTAEILDFSLNMSELTGGVLDCTMYPVLAEWGFTTGEYRIPKTAEITELLGKTGYEKISLEEKDLTVPEGMQVDLGAVGKGFAGDAVIEILKENGVESAILDLGGNIQTIGSKPDGKDWRLGLRDPSGEGTFAVLEISDAAVVTSGGYERYFVGDDGERYWHILDPETGCPARSGLVSVTIIGSEGKLCDALSTSIFVMGAEKATEYWRKNGGFEMVLADENGKIYITEGINDKITLTGAAEKSEMEVIYK